MSNRISSSDNPSFFSDTMMHTETFSCQIPKVQHLAGMDVLSGRVEEKKIVVHSKQLLHNLACAKEICEYVTQVVPFSVNYIARSYVGEFAGPDAYDPSLERPLIGLPQCAQLLQNGQSALQTVHWRLGTEVDRFREKFLKENPIESNLTQKEGFKLWANVVEKFGVGNCWMMASVGLKYAQAHFPENRVEYASLSSHTFLVIGRGSGHVVICDPWSNAFYQFADAHVYLKNCKDCASDPNFFSKHPPVTNFDPEQDQIEIFDWDKDKYFHLDATQIVSEEV